MVTDTTPPAVATDADSYVGEIQGTFFPCWMARAEFPRRAPGRHLLVGCSSP